MNLEPDGTSRRALCGNATGWRDHLSWVISVIPVKEILDHLVEKGIGVSVVELFSAACCVAYVAAKGFRWRGGRARNRAASLRQRAVAASKRGPGHDR